MARKEIKETFCDTKWQNYADIYTDVGRVDMKLNIFEDNTCPCSCHICNTSITHFHGIQFNIL